MWWTADLGKGAAISWFDGTWRTADLGRGQQSDDSMARGEQLTWGRGSNQLIRRHVVNSWLVEGGSNQLIQRHVVNSWLLPVWNFLGHPVDGCSTRERPRICPHAFHSSLRWELKGQCHEIFDFRFFFMDQFPPNPWGHRKCSFKFFQ